MPAGAIEQHNGMVARRDVATDLGEMQVHHLAVGYRQDEGDAGIARGTDGAEQIRPIVALVARCPRSAAAFRSERREALVVPKNPARWRAILWRANAKRLISSVYRGSA